MLLSSKWCHFLGVVSGTVFLTACHSAMAPVEQIHQVQKNNGADKTVSKQIETESTKQVLQFLCKNDQQVAVEYPKMTKKKGKKETITVTFQGVSYPLSSMVTKEGKKYTNIRWTWLEMRNGKAFLYNNTKKALAENCVKQR